MSVNIEVTKSSNENNGSILRRFTRRVQGSGVLPRVRSLRYSDRIKSHFKIKAKTLEVLKKKAEISKLIKLGKMQDRNSKNQ